MKVVWKLLYFAGLCFCWSEQQGRGSGDWEGELEGEMEVGE